MHTKGSSSKEQTQPLFFLVDLVLQETTLLRPIKGFTLSICMLGPIHLKSSIRLLSKCLISALILLCGLLHLRI